MEYLKNKTYLISEKSLRYLYVVTVFLLIVETDSILNLFDLWCQ